MPETPELHERVTKLQKDVEEIKEEIEDSWHERRGAYYERVKSALQKNRNAGKLYLEIDEIKSINEIERSLEALGSKIAHVTLWRAAQHLVREGLVRKVKIKRGSPVYAKKPWAKALGMDDYVRNQILPKAE